MVNIENLGEGTSLQVQAIGYQATLQVAHTALSLVHQALQGGQGARREGIDTTGNIAVTLTGVVEARDAQCLVGTYVERALVVDEIRHGHHAVQPLCAGGFLEGADVFGKFFFAENGVNGR